MEVRCIVFVDGSLTDHLATFSAVPRVGEEVMLMIDYQPLRRRVDKVVYVAKGIPEGPSVQLYVSRAD